MVLQTIEKQALDVVDQQEWLDQVSKPVQDSTSRVLSQRSNALTAIANFLHGTWVGHPLHSLLTDVTIGAFTSTVALDIMEVTTHDKAFGKGADASLVMGLSSSVLTATAGLADWSYTDGEARRTGTMHALLNITSTVFYLSSWFFRKAGNRPAGRALSFTGAFFTTLAAYLGGDLVYRQKIGVDHAQKDPVTKGDEWKNVTAESDLPEGKLTRVEVDGVKVLLVRRAGKFFAINEVCSHLGGPLAKGELLDDNSVVCPWHGSRFKLEDGKVLNGPAVYMQPCYEVRSVGGMIQIHQSK